MGDPAQGAVRNQISPMFTIVLAIAAELAALASAATSGIAFQASNVPKIRRARWLAIELQAISLALMWWAG